MQVQRFRRNKSKSYTTVCNAIMKERGVSLKAKGLYALIMSLPNDWDFSISGICAISKEQTSAIYSAIKELINAGYCLRRQNNENGRFSNCEYIFLETKDEAPLLEKPHTDFPHTEKKAQYIINTDSINNTKDNNEYTKEVINNNRLSNDNQKVQYSEDFLKFWKLYGYAKDKKTAYSRWNHLSEADKAAAIQAIPSYFEDCARCDRAKQHPSTYLSKRTFEDDFSAKARISFYDAMQGDSEEKVRFKAYMRRQYPEIENTALPLSYEDYMQMIREYGVESVTAAIEAMYGVIFKYRKSDIAKVIKNYLTTED